MGSTGFEDDFDEGYDTEEVVEDTDQIETQMVVGEESLILSYMFSNPSIFSKAIPILKPEYFSGVHAEAIKFVLEQYRKTHKVPNRLIISAKTGYLSEIVTDHDDPDVIQLIEESIESFCRKQAGNNFLINAVTRIEKDRSDKTMAGLREEMEKITRISMARNLGTEFHKDFRPMLGRAKENVGITTGSFFFDVVLGGSTSQSQGPNGGGLTRPSMSVYSAATGDGKSIFLLNRAVEYIRAFPEEDVIIYTLENSEELTYQRLAAIMTGIDIRLVFDQIDSIENYVFRTGKKEGRIFIKRFPFMGTTMADISGHFYDVRSHQSSNVRAVIHDYIELMEPTVPVKADNLHVRDEKISQEVYDFTHRERLIWWTAAQQTKTAEEETEAKKSKVSGGVRKIQACDNLFIAKRSEEDALNQRIWVHCKKARSSGGINSAIPLFWDRRSQKMSDWRGPQGNDPNGSDEEFRRANPKLFGIQSQTKVEADPVAREMGVKSPEAVKPSPANSFAQDIKARLVNNLKKPMAE